MRRLDLGFIGSGDGPGGVSFFKEMGQVFVAIFLEVVHATDGMDSVGGGVRAAILCARLRGPGSRRFDDRLRSELE